MNESAKLKLSVNEAGMGDCHLNGIDIGNCVSAIEIKLAPGKLTEIKLTVFAELDAEITAKIEQIGLAKVAETFTGLRFLKSRKAQT